MFFGAYGVTDFVKFPVWISKDEAPWVCYGADGKWLSQICSSNLKGWSSDAIANSRSFAYLQPSIARPPRNFENLQHLSNFEQMTSPEVVNNSGNEATSLARIPFLFA